MLITWWCVWLAFLFMFLVMGYGRGYRGSGPPVPRHGQRRTFVLAFWAVMGFWWL